MSPFDGFNCKPYYRLFPVDGTQENPYELKGTGYVVRKEYNVRFFCTWTFDDAVATGFSLQFGDSYISYGQGNMTQLRKIPKGYVVPLPRQVFQDQAEVSWINNQLF